MPLLLTEKISGSQDLFIWHLTEDEHTLLRSANLTASEIAGFDSITLEKRRREWLGTRLLLKHALPGYSLSFLPNGKPVLDNKRHLSISHNGDLAGLVVSTHPVGLDIQDVNQKLMVISRRFCSEVELNDASGSTNELEYITVLWCVKEAVFKCFGERVDFDKHIRVLPFRLGDEFIYADYNGVHGSVSFILRHLVVNNMHVLITL